MNSFLIIISKISTINGETNIDATRILNKQIEFTSWEIKIYTALSSNKPIREIIDARIVKSKKSNENSVCPRMALTTCKTVKRARILRLKSPWFAPNFSLISGSFVNRTSVSSLDLIPSISTRFESATTSLSTPTAHDNGRMNTFEPWRIPISAKRNSSMITSEWGPNSAKHVIKKFRWSSERI